MAAVEIYRPILGINDSKQLTPSQRRCLAKEIKRHAVQIYFGQASNDEIDSLGLATAQRLAYYRCLEHISADLVLTDNISLPNPPYLFKYIKSVKGDQFFYPVAAASIVAKVFRDRVMKIYHQFHPQYNWRNNAGYGTPAHKKALDAIGPSPLHRTSFL